MKMGGCLATTLAAPQCSPIWPWAGCGRRSADLTLALEGFGARHALMCQLHLEHLDHLDEMINRLDTQVEQMMVPFARQRQLLVTIPGIGPIAAAAILSEIGASPGEFFLSEAHLASWAGQPRIGR